MKKIIGIIPNGKLFANDDPYDDNYLFVNNYIKRVAENGGMPIGILSVDGRAVKESLRLCDAFLFCGGRRIWPYHFEVAEYAIKNRKPVLGICLGMQVICTYVTVAEEAKKRAYEGDLLSLYETMKAEKYMFTLPVDHHWDVPFTRADKEKTKHPVKVLPETRLGALLGKEEIQAVTLHKYRINGVPLGVLANAFSGDGVVEGVEFEDFVLGVQFHPEVDEELDALFRWLMEVAGAKKE